MGMCTCHCSIQAYFEVQLHERAPFRVVEMGAGWVVEK